MTRILHLSDPHFGAADPAVAEAFLSRASSLRYDLAILSGDLTMRARRRELNAAKRFVDAIPGSLLLIPGNHDIPALNHPLERFISPFRRYRRWFGEKLEPEWKDDHCHVVSLNSSRAFGLHADWSEGFLSPRQLAHAERRFLSPSFRYLRILVLHHPLLSPPGSGRALVRPLAALLKTIDTANIDLILCGHLHRSQIATAGILNGWHGIVSQAPTVCSIRLQGETQGFHEIHSDGDHLEITPWKFTGRDFEPASPLTFARTANGWAACGNTNSSEVGSVDSLSS